MLKIRDAKPLFALTVLFAPWDVLVFDEGIGWGMTFVFGRFTSAGGETSYLGPFELFGFYGDLGSAGVVGQALTVVWILTMAVGLLATYVAVHGRLTRGQTTPREDRYLGLTFVIVGLVFALSRLVGSTILFWTSIPLGALYVVFVGVVFHRGLFRLGEG